MKSILIIMLCLISVITVNAQHNHGGGGNMIAPKAPPHGGEVKQTGKYKIEMVANLFLKKDQLVFYLYKGNFKRILNKNVKGTVVFKTKNGKETTQKLEAKGDDFFVAQLSNMDSFYATVKFSIKDKIVSTMFTQYGIGHHHSTLYTCSMHPEVESENPGKCPKCGMNLVLKDK